MKTIKGLAWISILISLNAVIFTSIGNCQKAPQIIIVPFALHAEGDLAFLKEGIPGIMSANLAASGQVKNIDAAEVEQSLNTHSYPTPLPLPVALQLGDALGADFVISGSQTLLGDTVSTNATCVDVGQKKVLVTFNQVGQHRGDALAHIHQFSQSVKAALRGEPPEEKPVRQGTASPPGNPQGQAVLPAIWTSRKVEARIIGFAVGDLDGDGCNEIVFCSDKRLFIYRYGNTKLVKVTEIEGADYNRILSVDTADINHNGRAEIFVNAVRSLTGRIVSYVIESVNDTYKTILYEQNWHFKVLQIEQKSPGLYGQHGDMGKSVFRPGIFELVWEKGALIVAKRLDLPDSVTIYGVSVGPVLNNGKNQTIALSPRDKVIIYNHQGEPEWKSTEDYGGSEVYLEYPSELEPGEKDHYYLKQPVLLEDLDHDGLTEVILVRNTELSGRLFSRFRSYGQGHLECLVWNKIGLRKRWVTQEISGYISDYGLYDLNRDGHEALVYCVVTKGGFFSGRDNSYLVVQPLP